MDRIWIAKWAANEFAKKIKLYSSTEFPVRKNCIGKKREAVYNKLKFRAFLSQSERRNAE